MGKFETSVKVSTVDNVSYFVNASLEWENDLVVHISASSSEPKYVYGWRIKESGVDDPILDYTQGTSFQAKENTTYIFQGMGGDGKYRNDGSNSFTVTKDSGSSGGGNPPGSSASVYLTINQNNGTELTVEAWLSEKYWIKLKDGQELTNSMEYIRITCTALPGYYLKTYENSSGDTTVGYKYTWLMPTTATINGVSCSCYRKTSNNATVTSAAHPLEYKLSLSQGVGSSITVTRISSEKSGASTNTELHDGDTIYHFDELRISFNDNTGYMLTTHTVNEELFTSGNTLQVSGNVSIASEAIVQAYRLSLNLDTGSTAIINRTSSPLQNAQIGELDNNAIIYYSDVLSINTSSRPGYQIIEQYINDNEFVSGDSIEVQDNIDIRTVTELRGIVHIYNGLAFEQYLICIYHNGSWGQYIPYVYKDSKWNICS